MKSFGKYIAKHMVSFAGFILILLLINVIAFGWTFHSAIKSDYVVTSPNNMLEEVAAASTSDGLSEEARNKLESNHIWAIFLNAAGETIWSVNSPENIPMHYTVQDVAMFSRGYLKDYPVFVWNTDGGLLVLGYPKDSYTKLTSNYFSIQAIRTLPLYFSGMLAVDLLLLFFPTICRNGKSSKVQSRLFHPLRHSQMVSRYRFPYAGSCLKWPKA